MTTILIPLLLVLLGAGLFALYLAGRGIARLLRGEAGLNDLLVGGLILLAGAGLILFPTRTSHPHSNRVSCANNLVQIGKGCFMYGMDHNCEAPPSFQSLTNYVNDSKVFLCPSTKRKSGSLETVDQWTDYVLVTNLTLSMPSSLILAYCKPGNHTRNGINVLYLDGSVMWVNWTNLPSLSCDVLHLSRTSVTNPTPQITPAVGGPNR